MVIERLPAFYLVHRQKVVATRSAVQGYRISSEPPWLNLRGVSLR
jgi:peptide/nickel transport system substrate-binding protein